MGKPFVMPTWELLRDGAAIGRGGNIGLLRGIGRSGVGREVEDEKVYLATASMNVHRRELRTGQDLQCQSLRMHR